MRMHRTLLSDSEGIDAVKNIIGRQRVSIEGKLVSGTSLNSLRDWLRGSDYSLPNNDDDAIELLERMGFKIRKGLSGMNTRKGYQHCRPSTVVVNLKRDTE